MPLQTKSQNQIISLSMPQILIKKVQAMAKQVQKSRSQIFQEALKQYLWSIKWQELQAYGIKHSINLGLKPQDTQRLIDEYRKEKNKNSC